MNGAIEQADVINREIQLCGYFVIVTSAKMTAEEALVLYKYNGPAVKTKKEEIYREQLLIYISTWNDQ